MTKTLHDTFNLNSMGGEDSKRHNMENCLLGIAEGTCENGPKLNNEKTEFVVFASERQRPKVTSTDIAVDGIKVGAADDIKYVGMWHDNSLTRRKEVAAVSSKVSRNIALIRRNRKYLSLESCQKLASDLVMAILNYGNALYMGCQTKKSQIFRDCKTMLQKQFQARINMIVQHWPDINCIGYLWRKG